MMERVLGFDARLAINVVTRYWDAERRSTFLLNQDAERPLSVDSLVWPSLFDLGHGIGLAAEERAQLGLAGGLGENGVLPAWIGPDRPLWADVGVLRSHLQASADALPPNELIAVTLCTESSTLPALDDRWERFGYDVADSSLISALSNCGYTAQEAAELRLALAPRLNEHHLFDDVEPAFQFSLLANRRVPEHAPFYVYGLYRVETLP